MYTSVQRGSAAGELAEPKQVARAGLGVCNAVDHGDAVEGQVGLGEEVGDRQVVVRPGIGIDDERERPGRRAQCDGMEGDEQQDRSQPAHRTRMLQRRLAICHLLARLSACARLSSFWSWSAPKFSLLT